MRNIFKHRLLLEILFIFLLSLTPLLWFKAGTVMVGHDNVFGLDPITFLKGRLSTWADHGFGEEQNLMMGTIFTHLIDAFPSFLGFDHQTTQKIVYVFWFFMIGLSAYILASVLNKRSTVFKLTAVLLYQYNFFLLQAWWIGERTKFSAYIALPLILVIFIKTYRGEMKVLIAAILTSLTFFVFNAGGLYGIPLYGGLFIVIFVFLFFFGFFSIIQKDFVTLKRLFLLTVLSIIGYVLVSSYFIFPALITVTDVYRTSISGVGGIGGLIEWANVISANSSFLNLFRLQGIAEWYDNPEHPYASFYLKDPFLIISSFILPILIFSSLFVGEDREKRRIILFFFLVFLTGMFFSAGTHPPSGFIFETLMSKVPGLAVFRSPYYKFAPSLFIAASFLIAYLVDRFNGKTRKILFVAIFLFVLGYHFPFFTGEIFSWKKGFSTRLEIPAYVYEFGKWLEKEKKDEERVLMLPPNSPNLRYSVYDWGYLSFQSLPTLLSNKAVVINNDRINDNERKMVEALYESFAHSDIQSIYRLASHLGVGYFLLQNDTLSEDMRSSFSLNAKPYKEVLENSLHLPMFKKFGKWAIYKIDFSPLPIAPMFYIKDKATFVSGKMEDFTAYYDFTNNLQAIVKTGGVSDIYSPNCLKCKKKDKPFIKYPERNILPNSPFYPLVLFIEEKNLHIGDPKILIYDHIGLMLKRFSEVAEMIKKDIQLKDTVLNRYEATIRQINTNFNRLTKNEDKFDVAEDLSYYVEDQQSVITDMLGDKVRGGLPVVVLTQVLKSLEILDKAIEPYLFKPDITQNRLYSLTIDKSGIFNFSIHSREFANLLNKGGKIRVQIDDKEQGEIVVGKNTFHSKWLSFGDVPLASGDHTILLSFTEVINLVDEPSLHVSALNSSQKTQCYSTRIQDFDRKKRYKTIIRYRNDFLSDVNVYVWEEKEKETRIRTADRLRASLSEQEFTQDIEAGGDVKGIIIEICAIGLTKDYLRDRFDLRVHEYIEPIVLFISRNWQDSVTKEVKYQKISPTKYAISFTTASPQSILVFPTRFDNGWSLESFEKDHVLVNGFANGWVVDKPGVYTLTLEYKPQRIFKLGGLVSLMTVFGGVLYSTIFLITRRDKK